MTQSDELATYTLVLEKGLVPNYLKLLIIYLDRFETWPY